MYVDDKCMSDTPMHPSPKSFSHDILFHSQDLIAKYFNFAGELINIQREKLIFHTD